MTDPYEIARRMVAAGYIPAPAVLQGLGISESEYLALWNAHHSGADPRAEHRAALLDVAHRVTGTQYRRPGDARFALTQAAFGKGDAPIPDGALAEVLAVLRAEQAAGNASGRDADILDAAILRLERRETVARYRPRPSTPDSSATL